MDIYRTPCCLRRKAGDGTRTRDSLLGGQELYQLSYSRINRFNFIVNRLCCQSHPEQKFCYVRLHALAYNC